MATANKNTVDKNLRDTIFDELILSYDGNYDFQRINDRQYGVLMTDLNGNQRYVRIGAIVAELRDDMTAEELMQSEIDAYNQKQADKAEKAKARAIKAEKDKARRAKEKEENA